MSGLACALAQGSSGRNAQRLVLLHLRSRWRPGMCSMCSSGRASTQTFTAGQSIAHVAFRSDGSAAVSSRQAYSASSARRWLVQLRSLHPAAAGQPHLLDRAATPSTLQPALEQQQQQQQAVSVVTVQPEAEQPAAGGLKGRKKQRLDDACLLLQPQHSKNLVQSWILQGKVLVNGKVVTKAGHAVPAGAKVEICAEEPRFVCRGGFKLEAALERWAIDVSGLVAMDAGLSTGGFTDCLLQRGAAQVFGVDVGSAQAHARIRSDPRVVVMEQTNLRHLQPQDLPCQVDLATLDLSFISVLKVLPAVCGVLRPGGQLVVLVKPQFEAGRARVSAGGVVRDEAVRREVVDTVVAGVEAHGLCCQGVMESPLKGDKAGNTEYLAYFRHDPSRGPLRADPGDEGGGEGEELCGDRGGCL